MNSFKIGNTEFGIGKISFSVENDVPDTDFLNCYDARIYK